MHPALPSGFVKQWGQNPDRKNTSSYGTDWLNCVFLLNWAGWNRGNICAAPTQALCDTWKRILQIITIEPRNIQRNIEYVNIVKRGQH